MSEALLPRADQVKHLVQRHLPRLDPYEAVYKDLHRHPELSTHEVRTAQVVAEHLNRLGFLVRDRIGGHGVAARLDNGPGPTVLLRSELDALPVKEQTALAYASKARFRDKHGRKKPVMHACGHDMHMACLLAAAKLLLDARDSWSGNLVLVFQPDEEQGGGARAMLKDGLYEEKIVPLPDIVLGQHVVNSRAGHLATRPGYALAGKVVFEVTVYGRGGHGCAPQECIDPVVIASYIIIRLQTIISREVDPNRMALVTCGSVHAGDAPNVIPDEAMFKVDIRAYRPDVLSKVTQAFRRIVAAECEASAAKKPDIREIQNVPPLINDSKGNKKLTKQFKHFFPGTVERMKRDTASDDFCLLAPAGCPYVYWNLGSEDHDTWYTARKEGKLNELPANHSARYAPQINPTLKAGTEALAVAALTFLKLNRSAPSSASSGSDDSSPALSSSSWICVDEQEPDPSYT